jgi:meso-butanediol dehydrogenase/(S,S)-butanediol dehydrogenase/diacetyl reductase
MSALEGQVALVTGGSRGIGRGIVLALASAGVDIVIGDLLDDPLVRADAEATVATVEELGRRATVARCDVRLEADTDALVTAALDSFGRLDIVCANAGVCVLKPFGELTPAEWQRTFDINTTGVFLTCRSAVAALTAQGGGSIVATASVAGLKGGLNLAHYSASKFAVIGLVQSLALELGPLGIRANCVLPGTVLTDISGSHLSKLGVPVDQHEAALTAATVARMPLGRIQTPADVGQAVVYLCQADNVTGTSINVSGGSVL